MLTHPVNTLGFLASGPAGLNSFGDLTILLQYRLIILGEGVGTDWSKDVAKESSRRLSTLGSRMLVVDSIFFKCRII